MDMYSKYVSPFGYQLGSNLIDSYGINHRNFSLRDEAEYQYERNTREQKLIDWYKRHGITSNYPRYTTNFWGNNPANNYGFGMSDIGSNIEKMNLTMTPIPKQPIRPSCWETELDGKQVYDNVIKNEGNFNPQKQNIFDYSMSAIKSISDMVNKYTDLKNAKLTDKYKHAFINCKAAQYGQGGADAAAFASDMREFYDVKTGANTIDNSQGDQYANQIGRLLGGKYPKGDCDDIVQRYIKRYW